MKKLLLVLVIICMLLTLISCSSLPKGHGQIRVDNVVSYWYAGEGTYEYINENTVKFIRDEDGAVYYFDTSHIVYIKETAKD